MGCWAYGDPMKGFFQFLLAAVFLLTSSVCAAQQPGEHPALQQFRDKGGRVDFLGNAYGLDGWLVTNPKGGTQYVYTNSSGALLIGMLFAPDGTLETARQAKTFKEGVSPAQKLGSADKNNSEPALDSKSDKLYAETEKSGWVAVGESTAPYLYVFINATCGHCQNFWKDLEEPVKNGVLQVRLIPYGTTTANRDAAAALLSSAHPDRDWRAFIDGDIRALVPGKAAETAYLKVDANTAIVKNWHLPSPPFTLYRRPADGIVTAVVGRPENMMLLLAEFLR